MDYKKIYFAAGCFWGGEHFLRKLPGVKATRVGFANGSTPSPSYREVYTDTTGYAETVEVTYDPAKMPLKRLVEAFFVIIDPLSLNRQGEDEGTRYRTGIYWEDGADVAAIDEAYEREERWQGRPLAVEREPLRNFYPAEEEHQDYLIKHSDGYCHVDLKALRYADLLKELASLVEDVPDEVAVMANTAALLHETMKFFWTGFYRVADESHLALGPFQGPVACYSIGFGKGVCGTAWKRAASVVVEDVEQFPGHIACSSASRSEIVVPLFDGGGKVAAVLDIDSDRLATFDDTDRRMLEIAMQIVAAEIY
ncbi:MAG: peptide-methionine (S)-S-oxide reductase MsrA [Bacteroidales bacterium]|nr:peptide-methionine (S)-S-oxide reductase MsrA [Bacteroidales bacterium]